MRDAVAPKVPLLWCQRSSSKTTAAASSPAEIASRPHVPSHPSHFKTVNMDNNTIDRAASRAECDTANENLVHEALDAAITNSKAKYAKGWQIWLDFCDNFGFTPLPARCAAAKAKADNSIHPVKKIAPAVYAMHIKYNHVLPTENERFQRVMRGLSCQYFKPPKQATPMERDDLHQLIDWHLTESTRPMPDQLQSWRTIFRLLMCFRSTIRYDDVMRLLRSSSPAQKNDQKGEGRTNPIPPYDSEEKYCLIQTTRRYLDVIKNDAETPVQQGIIIVDKATKAAKLMGKNITRSTADKDRV